MNPEVDSFSQFGEDLLVWEFFGRATDGVFVEVGAHHPTHISQTCLLERQGWHGVLVEPQKRFADLLRQQRPRSQVFEYAMVAPDREGEAFLAIPRPSGASAYVTFNPPRSGDSLRVRTATMDWVLEQAGIERIDFLSIDIEGQELAALQGFSFAKYRPRLILMEDHLGSLHKHRLLTRHGYRLVDRIGYNQWYVPAPSHYPFARRTGRLELFRKMYLSLPFRKLKRLVKMAAPGAAPASS